MEETIEEVGRFSEQVALLKEHMTGILMHRLCRILIGVELIPFTWTYTTHLSGAVCARAPQHGCGSAG